LGDLEHGRYIEQMTDLSEEQKDDIFCHSACSFLNIQKEDFTPVAQESK